MNLSNPHKPKKTIKIYMRDNKDKPQNILCCDLNRYLEGNVMQNMLL